MRALLIGAPPPVELGWHYGGEPPYDGVVIGSLTLSQLLCFREDAVLEALAQGKPVVLYTPGLPEAPKNRALAASIASRRRELKNWGVLFVDGAQKRLITATEAQVMRQAGRRPGPGAVLTPLAREVLEGSD
jgi:hypothetical protein